MNGDNLCDASCGNTQGVVSASESVEDSKFGIDFTKTLVVDDEECIDVFGHFFNSVECLVNLAVALEAEGDSNDTYGKDAEFFGYPCDDGGGTCSCSTTHTCGDERHLGTVVEHIGDVVQTLFCCLAGFIWFVASSESFFSQLDMNGYGRVVERLIVRVAKHEGHIVDSFAVHVVDSIAATTTNTYHLDDAVFFFGCAEV